MFRHESDDGDDDGDFGSFQRKYKLERQKQRNSENKNYTPFVKANSSDDNSSDDSADDNYDDDANGNRFFGIKPGTTSFLQIQQKKVLQPSIGTSSLSSSLTTPLTYETNLLKNLAPGDYLSKQWNKLLITSSSSLTSTSKFHQQQQAKHIIERNEFWKRISMHDQLLADTRKSMSQTITSLNLESCLHNQTTNWRFACFCEYNLNYEENISVIPKNTWVADSNDDEKETSIDLYKCFHAGVIIVDDQ